MTKPITFADLADVILTQLIAAETTRQGRKRLTAYAYVATSVMTYRVECGNEPRFETKNIHEAIEKYNES